MHGVVLEFADMGVRGIKIHKLQITYVAGPLVQTLQRMGTVGCIRTVSWITMSRYSRLFILAKSSL